MAYPYIQARHHGPDTNLPVGRIVIHGTVTPCDDGWARRVAGSFSITDRDASAHYVCDPTGTYQCLSEKTIGYHAPPNQHAIGVELCDPQEGSGSRWSDAAHESMLVRAAGLVREIADRHDVPLVKLTSADLLAGKRGICGHVDVTYAWHETNHIDPGPDFPWAHFLDLVRNGDDDMQEADWARLSKLIDDRLTAKVADLVWSTETKLIDGAPRTYRSALAAIFKDAAALEAKQGNVNVTVKWDGPTA